MNILIFEGVASTESGGAERSAFEAAKYLAKENKNLYLAYEERGDIVLSEIWLSTVNINISSPALQGYLDYFKNCIKLKKFIDAHKIDLIFTHTIHGFHLLRLAKNLSASSPKIVAYFKWIYNKPYVGRLNKWGLNGLTKIISVNAFVESYWKKQISTVIPSEIIHDGIHFSEKVEDRNYQNNKTKITSLLFAGRIYEGKGLHILLRAVDNLKIKNVKLKIAGTILDEESVYGKEIKAAIEKLENKNLVEYLGYKSDMASLLEQSDLVIVPSIWPDAQPLVVLESIAAETLVIGSNVGGIPQILPSELIFDPTVKSLTELLRNITLNYIKYQKFIEPLNYKIKKDYDIATTLNQLVQSIENL